MKKTLKPKPIPKRLGAAVDALYTTRQDRLVIQQDVKEMSAYETRLKDHLIEALPKSDASGVAGKLARATITTKKVPQVEDWDAFYAHIKKTGSFDLLNKAVNVAAVVDRWDNGKEVPGVGSFTVVNVSVNKVS